MSARLNAKAEAVKLSRLLAVDPDELEFLEELGADPMRRFRELATERLFEADAAMFRRIAAAARLLPSALVATVAQRSFGPLLCARAAGSVDTGKALDVLKQLPPDFVADAAIEVDPRRVVDLIAAVPEDLVVPVARILGERGEYVTMGRFLAYVTDRAIVRAIEALSDEALLRTAFVLEHKDRLDHAVGLLPPDRLPGLISRASELGLWPEALDLLGHLSDARRGPIAGVVAGQEIDVIADLVAAVSAGGLWDSLLPIVRLMSGESLARLIEVPAFHERPILSEVVDAAADSEEGLWRDLAPLVQALPRDLHAVVAEIAGGLEPERLARIVRDGASTPEAVAPLVSLIAGMDAAQRRRVGQVVGEVASREPELVPRIVDAAASQRFWADLAPLLAVLPEETVAAAAAAAEQLSDEQLALVIEDALRTPETLPELVALIDHVPVESHQRVATIIGRTPQPLAAQALETLKAQDPGLLERLPPAIREAAAQVAAD